MDRLRAAEPGAWLVFDDPIGSHDAAAVARALAALGQEGLLDLRGSREARLAIGGATGAAA